MYIYIYIYKRATLVGRRVSRGSVPPPAYLDDQRWVGGFCPPPPSIPLMIGRGGKRGRASPPTQHTFRAPTSSPDSPAKPGPDSRAEPG